MISMRKHILMPSILVLALILLAIFLSPVFSKNGGEKEAQAFSTSFPATEVRDLSIALNGTSLNVRTGETDALLINTVDAAVETEFDGSRLTVSERKTFRRSAAIDIVLPEGYTFDNFSAALGAGNMTASNFSCGNIMISCDVGNVRLLLRDAPDMLNLNIGVGDAEITFPGKHQISIKAPYGLGDRDYAERFIVTDDTQYVINVSVGNTTLR